MQTRIIKKLLIANRGEIACRIIRSCHARGISTVAIYSEPDARALHVRLANERIALGGTETRESYLNIDKVLAAAQASQCDAIHPGYGFLSENADFAARVLAAGLLFVGPSPHAIRTLGDKLSSKKIARAASVPLLPSVEDIDWATNATECRPRIESFVKQFGFPLLIKASAGGGGRGMKKVLRAEELEEALNSASREAQSFFGNGMLFIERYVEQARHVEVQILGDEHGNAVHLFDRDCSCQRNHQKVIEEAPAPLLKDSTRTALYDASCRLAKAAKYSNAGTVEFLVDKDETIYFLEVNSRLQVEHPVTEAITGLDLVALQLEIAEGRNLAVAPLPIPLQPSGCAIEVRICAEQPEQGFIAATGKLYAVTWPNQEYVRIDSGFTQGDRVTHYYDSLLAKLVVTGTTRQEALQHLYDALDRMAIAGVSTNLAFIYRLIKHADFLDVKHHIQWAQQFAERTEDGLLYAAIGAALLNRRPWLVTQGPWNARNNFRCHAPVRQLHRICNDEQLLEVEVIECTAESLTILHQSKPIRFHVVAEEVVGHFRAIRLHADNSYHCLACTVGGVTEVIVNGQRFLLEVDGGVARESASDSSATFQVRSPLPGKVVAVKVQPSDHVEEGQVMAILESMKMEHPIVAPRKSSVTSVHVGAGAVVEAKTPLFEMAARS